MKTFLFIGGSLTDAGRNKENDSFMGSGYPTLTAAEICKKYPGEFDFINRGMSGERVVDLYARIKRDIINHKPDYLCILIGVNDVWHELGARHDGVSAEKYEKIYSMMIEEIKTALPEIKIFILEPFILNGEVTAGRMELFLPEIRKRAVASKRVAEKYSLFFIPLQNKFDELLKAVSSEYVTTDGVHLKVTGHALISMELIKAFDEEVK